MYHKIYCCCRWTLLLFQVWWWEVPLTKYYPLFFQTQANDYKAVFGQSYESCHPASHIRFSQAAESEAISADSKVSGKWTWLYTVRLEDASRCTSSSRFRKLISPPPPRLFDLVFCSCKMGCITATCMCRKAGRVCTPICGACLRETCTNVGLHVFDDMD